MTNSRGAEYKAFLKRAYKMLGVKDVDDERVQHLVVLLAAREAIAGSVFTQREFSIADLLRLDEAVKAHLPPSKADISFRFVGRDNRYTCEQCGYEGSRHEEPSAVERARMENPCLGEAIEPDDPRYIPYIEPREAGEPPTIDGVVVPPKPEPKALPAPAMSLKERNDSFHRGGLLKNPRDVPPAGTVNHYNNGSVCVLAGPSPGPPGGHWPNPNRRTDY